MRKPRKQVERAKEHPLPLLPDEGIRLHLNENPFGPPPKVKEALKNFDPETLSRYPDPTPFREKLARSLGVLPEEVLLTNGADEAIQTIANTYLEEGDEVVIPTPTFITFKKCAELAGAKIIDIPYPSDLSFPKEKLLSAISKRTKLIVLITPDNPMGTVIPEEDIIEIIERGRDSLIVIDETYHHFAGRSLVPLIRRYDNLLIIGSFSKAYGLAGARVGYIVSDRKNISLLWRVLLPFTISAVSLALFSAAIDDAGYVDFVIRETAKAREFTFSRLDELGIPYHPTKTSFFLMKLGMRADMVVSYLRERGIFVRPLEDGLVRISIGRKEDMEKFTFVLAEIACPDALIFDIDGVLIDVSSSYREAIRRTVAEFTGYLPTPEEVQEYKEKGGLNDDWELTKRMIEDRGVKVSFSEVVSSFNRRYFGEGGEEPLYLKEHLLIPPEVLAKLKKRFKLGVATGRTRKATELALSRFGIKDYFDAVITLDETPNGKRKPHPYPVAKAMSLLGAKRAYYFGDNVDDIKAGISASAHPIGVMPPGIGGKRLRELFREAGALLVLDHPRLIPELFPELK
ncbi:MAG: aminotransferase class I/II-fold pyridoxal phosphate-dependent enzyme [Acidobacteria bacterium]|nr:aminotransferase class I/II-fold pyridoxal phosphate-dependent enzyme [Acidobacteriota bacterium]